MVEFLHLSTVIINPEHIIKIEIVNDHTYRLYLTGNTSMLVAYYTESPNLDWSTVYQWLQRRKSV